ncbi:hypothetical protein TEA_005216 [Camellia sinensis var. sinensis]|uniref:Serine hydrolase domain-containing protein n=1 Tax=Camellia sinensis var. sinensis TaxID=542762 RepID=A0A4S4EA38_CAMSN|nr:hypothetical protein TEA_005216 [Camellia sinensis var. sinensis]
MEEKGEEKRMKILCLHGFRTSGSFLQKQISKWDPSIFTHHFHMEFPDGIYEAGGKSDIEGIFPPPYFEWFQFNKYVSGCGSDGVGVVVVVVVWGDGSVGGGNGSVMVLGATLSALLMGYQAQGKVLKEHPPLKLFVSISGSKFRDPSICEIAYKDPINVRSVHFIGDKDWLKLPSEELATAFHNPLILRHPQGHTVPRLDEDTTEKLRSWTKEILFHHQTNTDAASNDNGDDDKYDTSRENGDSSAKVEEEPKCHEVAHNSDHSSNKESNSAMVKRESEVVVVAQA